MAVGPRCRPATPPAKAQRRTQDVPAFHMFVRTRTLGWTRVAHLERPPAVQPAPPPRPRSSPAHGARAAAARSATGPPAPPRSSTRCPRCPGRRRGLPPRRAPPPRRPRRAWSRRPGWTRPASPTRTGANSRNSTTGRAGIAQVDEEAALRPRLAGSAALNVCRCIGRAGRRRVPGAGGRGRAPSSGSRRPRRCSRVEGAYGAVGLPGGGGRDLGVQERHLGESRASAAGPEVAGEVVGFVGGGVSRAGDVTGQLPRAAVDGDRDGISPGDEGEAVGPIEAGCAMAGAGIVVAGGVDDLDSPVRGQPARVAAAESARSRRTDRVRQRGLRRSSSASTFSVESGGNAPLERFEGRVPQGGCAGCPGGLRRPCRGGHPRCG